MLPWPTGKNMTTMQGEKRSEGLAELVERYPWWGAARMALHNGSGAEVPDSVLYAAKVRGRLAPQAPQLKFIDSAELRRSETLGIIDEFLKVGEHRIVIAEQTTDVALDSIDNEDDGEEEFVSEELAEIYAAQGLFDLAIDTYRKLSLQNSQKSIYFAELIEALMRKQAENGEK